MTEEIMTIQREDVAGTNNAQVLAEINDNLRRVFQAVQEHSKRVERETGLTGPQAWTIRVIADNEPINISDIARRMYLHVATVVGIVDRLELRGFVRRTRDQKDRRVVYVMLTEEGRLLIANAPQVAHSLLLSGLDVLPNRKLKTVQAGFEILARILSSQNLPPQMLTTEESNNPETSSNTQEKAAVTVRQT
jgi:MarR family transcriptional regulator, organic hydroperoxide resistance regulator